MPKDDWAKARGKDLASIGIKKEQWEREFQGDGRFHGTGKIRAERRKITHKKKPVSKRRSKTRGDVNQKFFAGVAAFHAEASGAEERASQTNRGTNEKAKIKRARKGLNMPSNVWIYQVSKEVEEKGRAGATWYVGWVNKEGIRCHQQCGPGSNGKAAANILRLKIGKKLNDTNVGKRRKVRSRPPELLQLLAIHKNQLVTSLDCLTASFSSVECSFARAVWCKIDSLLKRLIEAHRGTVPKITFKGRRGKARSVRTRAQGQTRKVGGHRSQS